MRPGASSPPRFASWTGRKSTRWPKSCCSTLQPFCRGPRAASCTLSLQWRWSEMMGAVGEAESPGLRTERRHGSSRCPAWSAHFVARAYTSRPSPARARPCTLYLGAVLARVPPASRSFGARTCNPGNPGVWRCIDSAGRRSRLWRAPPGSRIWPVAGPRPWLRWRSTCTASFPLWRTFPGHPLHPPWTRLYPISAHRRTERPTVRGKPAAARELKPLVTAWCVSAEYLSTWKQIYVYKWWHSKKCS